MAKVRTQRHIVREKARKRTKSLFKKANELAQIADADIYIVINRGGKYQIYRSNDQPGWPPSEQEMALSEIVKILSMYSKFNSREDYITLLDSLETLTTELRQEIRPKRQRKKKTKQKETQFNHGLANIPQFPNVATRSRGAVSATDLSSLMLRSHLRTEPPSVSQGATITDRSNVANSQSEMTPVNHENSTPKAEARPAATNIAMQARDKLKQEIERCEKFYRGKTFIVNGDERSETVYPDEINLKRNSIRHYDSLAEDISKHKEVVSAIKERLAYAMEGWESPNRDFTMVSGASQQQENSDDCGIYMIYNADCLASIRDTLEERIDGVQLRYRYLERLLELERQGRSERQIVDMILPPRKTLRIKRRRVPEDISDDESNQDQQGSRKSRRVDWRPPLHLGSHDAWIEERNYLTATISKQRYGRSKQDCGERAEELLRMIEAIGCEDVMTTWDEAIAEEKLGVRLPTADSTAKAICQLVERAHVRSFKDKVLLRIGKWIFTMKMLQDVEKLRKDGAPSRQSVLKADVNVRGPALKRAFANFMGEAHPELQEPELNKQRDVQYAKYRNWWREGQIWVLLYNAFGAAILLLVPAGQRAEGGYSINNQQYVDIKSSDREPFINALQKLRPDLKKTVSELDDHLEVLKDDIADLLGRLKHPRISQELKVEQPKGNP
ncbi:hypothetical protein OEA41_008704 [Lepraria neglecta]|uniref:Ubiquitin-like protease family profile domain-containing protein n=1 Tax=Lepraria neglecta TaxID=209136 RepID=A0AAD9Z0L7_9LECA|nr:hypothetical protein OEA41_008704 [Lepraria neglecta]